jgi:hypothetical protein
MVHKKQFIFPRTIPYVQAQRVGSAPTSPLIFGYRARRLSLGRTCATLTWEGQNSLPMTITQQKFMNTLLVVADLGGFKAFKLENNTYRLNQTPRLELLEHFENPAVHGRLVDRVSDLAGRFPRRTGARAAGAMSDGERHNIELETRKRFIRQLAQRLNVLARNPEIDRCFLAASREINHPLLEELEPQVRAKVALNLPADLTKLGQTEILSHFGSPATVMARRS